MKSVNLIPGPRREAKRRRKHRLVCAIACGAYGVLLTCAVGAAHLLYSGDTRLEQRLAATADEIRHMDKQSNDARAELTKARATIEANRTIAEQPDWSVLLTLLAKTTGEDVVLRSVSIAPPVVPTGPVTAKDKTPDAVLELMGIGRSQLAVSQHVLRLEQTGLFSKVALLDTSRESYLNANAIAFRLQCTFGEPPQRPTAQPTPALSSLETGGSR